MAEPKTSTTASPTSASQGADSEGGETSHVPVDPRSGSSNAPVRTSSHPETHNQQPASTESLSSRTITGDFSNSHISPADEDRVSSSDENRENIGITVIADVVVAKIAGIAAHAVPGIHDFVGGSNRTAAKIRDQLPASLIGATKHIDFQRGITVTMRQEEAAITVNVIAEYGIPLPDLAQSIRHTVIREVEGATGLTVTEVNIIVHDIHLPNDQTGDLSDLPFFENR